jgi:hypothetical protein
MAIPIACRCLCEHMHIAIKIIPTIVSQPMSTSFNRKLWIADAAADRKNRVKELRPFLCTYCCSLVHQFRQPMEDRPSSADKHVFGRLAGRPFCRPFCRHRSPCRTCQHVSFRLQTPPVFFSLSFISSSKLDATASSCTSDECTPGFPNLSCTCSRNNSGWSIQVFFDCMPSSDVEHTP